MAQGSTANGSAFPSSPARNRRRGRAAKLRDLCRSAELGGTCARVRSAVDGQLPGRPCKRTGYFWPVLKGCEVACGLCLLSGYFVPLALVVVAPVVVHIFLFHVFLSPPLGLGLFLLVAEAYLGWEYR